MTERQRSDRYEKRLAKQLGGQRIAGSGSSKEKPQDLKFVGALLQAKRTTAKSTVLHKRDLEQVEADALNAGRIPLFCVAFCSGADEPEQEWMAFPTWWVRQQPWWESFKGED